MDNVNHIKNRLELLKESARKIHGSIELLETEENKGKYLDIVLKDKNGYILNVSYGDVNYTIGFINGYYSSLNNKN